MYIEEIDNHIKLTYNVVKNFYLLCLGGGIQKVINSISS